MAKSSDLSELISRGDYSIVTGIFNRRQKRKRHHISPSYVGKLIRGERQAEVADEVKQIAAKYLKKKRSFEQELLAI